MSETLPPCKLAESTKGWALLQAITSFVSTCRGAVRLANLSGKFLFKSLPLALVLPMTPALSPKNYQSLTGMNQNEQEQQVDYSF